MNNKTGKYAVTGAFGYSGSYIASQLLEAGKSVITLTNSVNRKSELQQRIEAYPFNFDCQEKLRETLKGVSVLCNTYWVRFNHKDFCFADAVKNSSILFQQAKKAGVERIVHISITNASQDSSLEYFSGKAEVEAALQESGVSYAILRPAVLFGKEDILINNIAWTLRNFPIFGIFGNGSYRLCPIYVGDLAKLVVEQCQSRENVKIDAIGPECFTYKELVQEISKAIGKKRILKSVSSRMACAAAAMIGKLLGDVLVTPDELEGLMSELLYVDSEPVGTTRLTDWLKDNANGLGKKYANEMSRRNDRRKAYFPAETV